MGVIEEKTIAEVGHDIDVVDTEVNDNTAIVHKEYRGVRLISKTYRYKGEVRLEETQKELPPGEEG